MKKPKKKKTITQLKKQLDVLFSTYVRQKYADKRGMVACYTCGKTLHWKEIQAGHYLSRSYLATRYDEENVRPQCVGDNIFGGGRSAIFGSNLERELGTGTIAKLHKKAQEIVRYFPYEEKIQYYQEKLKEMK